MSSKLLFTKSRSNRDKKDKIKRLMLTVGSIAVAGSLIFTADIFAQDKEDKQNEEKAEQNEEEAKAQVRLIRKASMDILAQGSPQSRLKKPDAPPPEAEKHPQSSASRDIRELGDAVNKATPTSGRWNANTNYVSDALWSSDEEDDYSKDVPIVENPKNDSTQTSARHRERKRSIENKGRSESAPPRMSSSSATNNALENSASKDNASQVIDTQQPEGKYSISNAEETKISEASFATYADSSVQNKKTQKQLLEEAKNGQLLKHKLVEFGQGWGSDNDGSDDETNDYDFDSPALTQKQIAERKAKKDKERQKKQEAAQAAANAQKKAKEERSKTIKENSLSFAKSFTPRSTPMGGTFDFNRPPTNEDTDETQEQVRPNPSSKKGQSRSRPHISNIFPNAPKNPVTNESIIREDKAQKTENSATPTSLNNIKTKEFSIKINDEPQDVISVQDYNGYGTDSSNTNSLNTIDEYEADTEDEDFSFNTKLRPGLEKLTEESISQHESDQLIENSDKQPTYSLERSGGSSDLLAGQGDGVLEEGKNYLAPGDSAADPDVKQESPPINRENSKKQVVDTSKLRAMLSKRVEESANSAAPTDSGTSQELRFTGDSNMPADTDAGGSSVEQTVKIKDERDTSALNPFLVERSNTLQNRIQDSKNAGSLESGSELNEVQNSPEQGSEAAGVVAGGGEPVAEGGDNAPRNNFNILMGQIKKIKVSEDQTPAAQADNAQNPNHAEVVLANLDEPAGAGQDKQDQAPSAPEQAIKSIVDRLEQTPPASAQAREPRVNSEKAGRKYDTRGGVDSVLSDLASKLSDRIIARSAAVAAGDDLDNKKDSNIWMRAIYGSSVQNPTTGNIGYRGNIAGGSIGAEYETAGGTVFGAVYSNLKGKYIYKDQDRADIRFNIFSIYAEAEIKNFVLLGMASYGHNKVKTRDYINDAQPSEFGSFTSKSYGFDAMVGYKIKKNNIDFLPFVEARYSGSSDSAYTAVKDDGSAGTSYDKTSLSALLVRLGIRASKPIPYCGFMITPYVNLSVERDVNAQKSKVSAYDTDGSRINLSLSERGKEFERAKFGYNIEGGMALRRGNTEVSASYKGHFRKNYHSHQGSLKLKLFL